MELQWTFFWLLGVVALIGLAIWRDSKPRQNGQAHWFSWKPVLMISVVVAIVLIVHILNVLGIETGKGRGRP